MVQGGSGVAVALAVNDWFPRGWLKRDGRLLPAQSGAD
jgi:hypothetical protein